MARLAETLQTADFFKDEERAAQDQRQQLNQLRIQIAQDALFEGQEADESLRRMRSGDRSDWVKQRLDDEGIKELERTDLAKKELQARQKWNYRFRGTLDGMVESGIVDEQQAELFFQQAIAEGGSPGRVAEEAQEAYVLGLERRREAKQTTELIEMFDAEPKKLERLYKMWSGGDLDTARALEAAKSQQPALWAQVSTAIDGPTLDLAKEAVLNHILETGGAPEDPARRGVLEAQQTPGSGPVFPGGPQGAVSDIFPPGVPGGGPAGPGPGTQAPRGLPGPPARAVADVSEEEIDNLRTLHEQLVVESDTGQMGVEEAEDAIVEAIVSLNVDDPAALLREIKKKPKKKARHGISLGLHKLPLPETINLGFAEIPLGKWIDGLSAKERKKVRGLSLAEIQSLRDAQANALPGDAPQQD